MVTVVDDLVNSAMVEMPASIGPRGVLVVSPTWVRLVAVGAVLGVISQTVGLEPSDGSDATHVPKVIPWLEVNAPTAKVERWFPDAKRSRPDLSMRDYALEGIKLWAEVSDTVIVSSRSGQIHLLYPYLMDGKPARVRIVGGLKTFSLPGVLPGDARRYDFADADGWREIAKHARDVARMTKTNIVVLENETTLGRFTRGEVTIDYERLTASLAVLRETGIVFWWNLPRILGNSSSFPDRAAQSERLVVAIGKALPTAVFLSGYSAWYDSTREERRRETMIERVGFAHMQERLLVTPDGHMHYPGGRRKRCFTPAEAVKRLRQMKGEDVNVYSGGAFWVSVAEEFVTEWKKIARP